MSRDWRWFLLDLIDFCERILEYSAGLDQEGLLSSRLNLDAILRNIETLGEAAKHVPPEFREKLPEIPWPKLIGMRNALIHEYFGIDNDVLWDVVSNKVPTLLALLRRARGEHSEWFAHP